MWTYSRIFDREEERKKKESDQMRDDANFSKLEMCDLSTMMTV